MTEAYTPIPFITRTRMACKLGQQASERAEAKAAEQVPGFTERALQHIRSVARALGPDSQVRGEDLVNGAKLAGIRPHDDRAYGPIFQKAIRDGLIVPVGYAPRVKGHGTAGGRVYARGVCV